MNEFIVSNAVLISQIGVVFAILLVIRTTMKMRTPSNKSCPDCKEPLPAKRLPTDLYELIIGGWTCSKCKTKLTYNLQKR
jgi:ribosomal protein L37AE/L43A